MNVLVRADNAPVAIHPPGFRVSDHRKAIPNAVKFNVSLRWEGRCARCCEKLQEWKDTDFDHHPALETRPWDETSQDFVPPQLDPLHIAPVHRDCHRVKTFGRGGTKRISTAGSDVGNAGKVRRITATQEAFRAKLLAKSEGAEVELAPTRGKAKTKWPKRPFPKSAGFRKKPPKDSKTTSSHT